MASKVYYMDARSYSPQTSMVSKTLTVFEAAGFDKLIKPRDIVAIKLHCGEWDNTGYLRPVYARALADRVKSLGGRPFVCDTTTMPTSICASRTTALDIMFTAERNGYSSAVLGCPFICADGFIGDNDYQIDLPEGYILKEAFIAKAIAASDVLITLSHFKGHGMGVFGGAIKNLGIGAQSKRGKFNCHMSGHPKYGLKESSLFQPENFKGRQEKGWEVLEQICPYDLIHVTETSVEIEWDKCNDCRACEGPLRGRGIIKTSVENLKALNAAIADGCLATMKTVGRENCAFINLAIDLTPYCDCPGFSDVPILPNLGVFASSDPVAIDKACLDMSKEAPGIKGSAAEELEVMGPGTHKFEVCSAHSSGALEDIQVNTGEIIGMGTRDYEIVEVPEKTLGDFAFPPDPRPVGTRHRVNFPKLLFPNDTYFIERRGSKNFQRKEEVDLEKVNKYYENTENITKV